jgi:uncharacterized membrane protein SpoIIM required for sporulation
VRVRQAEFEARHRPEWQRFERWLLWRALPARRRRDSAAPADALADAEVPAAYRRLCAELALAGDRLYSPDLCDYLNDLVLRAHHVLYAAPARRGNVVFTFLARDFPRRLRSEWRLLALASLLFFGPFLGLIAAIQFFPDLAGLLLSPLELSELQQMYDPDNEILGRRDSTDNVAMFGMYIWNNVRIGFQTFAGGIVFGLGSLFFLLFNGLFLGAIAGHLTEVGLGVPLWSFVAGHSAMELSAIAISGAAGFKLGAALIAPGQRSRRAALVANGRIAAELIGGAAVMFLVAAGIEAFWSPINLPDPTPKYAVGIALWILLLLFLGLAGRDRGT